MILPRTIRIVEVGPRDGLQNEPQLLPIATKAELIERLADAGLPSVEAGAFVSPRSVPQMADTAAVLKSVRRRPNVSYPVLVPNLKGLGGRRRRRRGRNRHLRIARSELSNSLIQVNSSTWHCLRRRSY